MENLFFASSPTIRREALAELATAGPLHQIRLPFTPVPAWVVTGYPEARAALADPRLVKNSPNGGMPGAPMDPDLKDGLTQDILSMDPPRHTRLRKLVTLAFTRRRVDLLEPAIRALVASLLDDVEKQLAATGEADLITLFARPLPFTVICDLLGIPAEARARMAKYSTTDTPGKDYAAQARDVLACIRELIAGKRAEPADDLLTALIQARDDGERMTEGELTSMVQLLFVAGHETTVSLLANGIFAQLTDPDQFATDGDDPSRWSDAVEEILRFDGPVVTALPRFAAEPMEIAGRQIAGGDMVLISVLAANHDGARFDDPATLRLTRETAGHLSFGHGIHHCVGAPLARLQGRIALAAFAERFPDVRLAVEPDALRLEPSLIFNKLAALPIRRD